MSLREITKDLHHEAETTNLARDNGFPLQIKLEEE